MKLTPFHFVSILLIAINSLITVSAANYYWVGNSGNWDAYSTHWAITSGGSVFHTASPTSADDVFFDANSFSITGAVVTINVNADCNSMTWTGATFAPSLTATVFYPLNIYSTHFNKLTSL